MNSNKDIDRLLEVQAVNFFIAKHEMKSIICRESDEHSLLVFRHPFFVEFCDYKIENYLEIILSDMTDGLLITGSSALACSVELDVLSSPTLQTENEGDRLMAEIFSSHKVKKLNDLYSFLGAIDALLPLVEAKGLSSMQNGTFDPRFDFSQAVSPLYPGLRERYLACMR